MDNSGDTWGDGRSSLARLVDLQSAFAATIDHVDADAVVPWSRQWRVRDLVEHLAYVHHWAAAMARGEDATLLPPAGSLRIRYEDCAAELQETLRTLDPQAPARTLVENGTVAFWHRRQLHENLVHLWDLRSAGGLHLDVEAALWADTVDEAITVMHPRQVRPGRAPASPVRLLLTADDVRRSWTLPTDAGERREPAAAVSGSAETLALLVWGRTDVVDSRLQVVGDAAALEAVLTDHFVP